MSKFDALVGNDVSLRKIVVMGPDGKKTEVTQEQYEQLEKQLELIASQPRRSAGPFHRDDQVDGIRFIGDTHINEWDHWIRQRRSNG